MYNYDLLSLSLKSYTLHSIYGGDLSRSDPILLPLVKQVRFSGYYAGADNANANANANANSTDITGTTAAGATDAPLFQGLADLAHLAASSHSMCVTGRHSICAADGAHAAGDTHVASGLVEMVEMAEVQGSEVQPPTMTTLMVAYKRENLANDAIVMRIVRLMKGVLNTGGMEDIPLVTYNVLPTGPGEGMIEFVQNAKTLSAIQKEHGKILNYLVACNPNRPVHGTCYPFLESIIPV